MQLQQGKKKAGSGSSIPVVKLHKKALARLEELGIEEEHLFEVRIDGFAAHPYPRIWGIRTGRYLNVLWWDPNHEVYHTDANKKERRRKDADPKARALPDQESCPPGIAGSSDRCPFCFVRESERT